MGSRGRPRHPDVLTPREWEVLGLLRKGLTNEQIAERLGVSFATARYHVSEILSKLGVSSREEAARWQPEPERRAWWRLAWPLTALKAAGVALAVAMLAGLGVLGWSVLAEDSSDPSMGRIAFVSDRDGDYDIWVVYEDGTGLRKVTDFGDDWRFQHLEWSDDGRTIRFAAVQLDAGFTTVNQYTVNADGSDLQDFGSADLTDAGKVFSPDGALVAYRRTSADEPTIEAWISESDGSEARKLVAEEGYHLPTDWSSDGATILLDCADFGFFEGVISPAAETQVQLGDICTVRPDGTGLTRIIEGASSATWSPDGRRLIFRKGSTLWIAEADGTNQRPLMKDSCCQDSNPAWWQPGIH
jgi:DNA-binding CsgD family transcriptional regulator/Tol biopolymer transport system component